METDINTLKEEIARQRRKRKMRRNIAAVSAVIAVPVLYCALFYEYHLDYDGIPGGYVISGADENYLYYNTKISGEIRTVDNWVTLDTDYEKGIIYISTDLFFSINNFNRFFMSRGMKTGRSSEVGYGINYDPEKNFTLVEDEDGNEHKCTWFLVAKYYRDRDGERHLIWVRDGYEGLVSGGNLSAEDLP